MDLTGSFEALLIFALLFASNLCVKHPEYREVRTEGNIPKAKNDVISYVKYQLWKVSVNGSSDIEVIEALEKQNLCVSWKVNKTAADILLNPDNIERVQNELKRNRLSYMVHIKNVQKVIDETTSKAELPDDANKGHAMDWVAYHRLETIYGFLNAMVKRHPKLCTVMSLGQTAENREILMLRITDGKARKRVWLDGGIHAREWVSPAAVTYIIDQIIIQYAHDQPNPFKDIDWYIVPVLNPDGYEYSHTSNRLWRKNRSRVKASGDRTCIGVDLNRNFGYQWHLELDTSPDPCSSMYSGPAPFSEAETAAVARFFIGNHVEHNKWHGFISLHSYGQQIVYPWASRDLSVTYDDDELQAIATKAAKTVARSMKTTYTVGSMSEVIVGASGTATDWARGSVAVRYAFIIELQDDGKFAFMLPNAKIITAVKEAYVIVESLADSILALA